MARTLRMLGRGGRLIVCPRNPASTTWLTKETSEHHISTIQWRGRTNAASAASDIPNSQRDHKKVSKDERRAMLESYVNKYREANAGKFPSASKARSEVGGRYYTVRQIIQELRYYSELDPSTSGMKTSGRKEPRRKTKSIIAVDDIQTQVRGDIRSEDVAESISFRDTKTSENLKGETTTDHEIVKPAAESVSFKDTKTSENLRDETATDHEIVKPAAAGITPDLVEAQSTFLRKDDQTIPHPPERREDSLKETHEDQPKFVSEQNHVKEGIKEDVGEDKSTRKLAAEVGVGQAGAEVSKGLSDSGSSEMQEKQHQASTESERDIQTPKKSSLWGDLKSFADDLLSIWRNR